MNKNKQEFIDELVLYRKRAVPIIVIDGSLDQQATLITLTQDVLATNVAVFEWNFADGLKVAPCQHTVDRCGHKETADRMLKQIMGEDGEEFMLDAMSALEGCKRILALAWRDRTPSAFIFRLADRLYTQYNDSIWGMVQLLNNMRDTLKVSQGTVYLIGQSFQLPREMKENTVTVSEPLPSQDERLKVIDETLEVYQKMVEKRNADGDKIELKKYGDKERLALSEALKGSSSFASEQALSLSIDIDGINMNKVREKKTQMVNSTVGLMELPRTGKGFKALGGLDNIKSYASKMKAGRLETSVIVRIEEVEKMLGGATGQSQDSSGTSQAFLGSFLTFMQDKKCLGMMLTGVYGCGKSAFTVALAEEYDVLGVEMNMNSMKASLVGESEANLSNALNVLSNIAGDTPILFLATCNRPESLPPEFKSRFNLGTFFFCYPTDEEKVIIWDIYRKIYNVKDMPDFDDDKWTGREIEGCCRQAYLMDCPLEEASRFITPIHKTASKEIEQLMAQAHNRYLSTTQSGMFDKNTWDGEPKSDSKSKRRMEI